MKLYISIKVMTFEDGIEHEVISKVSDKKFLGYDEVVEFLGDEIPIIKEQNTWWNFPLYELKDGEIINFDYTKYEYFANTERRNLLADKISEVYSGSSEMKIQRKTLKKILDHLGIEDESFLKYNNKVEAIISKNPKT